MSKPNMNHTQRKRPRAVRPAGNPESRMASGDEPDISQPYTDDDFVDNDYERKHNNEVRSQRPVNPYAPTGWRGNNRAEFDVRLPDELDDAGNVVREGQLCRMMRLERDDFLRLGLQNYLDTFTPMLMSDMSAEEKDELMQDKIKNDPEALTKLFGAMDVVVMAACLKPRITDDESKVNYGTDADWDDPDFVATVLLENINLNDRMYMFGMAFGRSMDDLKSILEQKNSVGSVEN